MAKASDVMNIAVREIGVKELPTNRVKYNTEYYGVEVSGNAYAWCCSFVWWVFKHANASDLFYCGKKTAYCPSVDAWGQANNLCVDKRSGKYGDIVLFDWDGGSADHIGFIERNNGDGTYDTIEGNTSISNNSNGGMVMRRTRSVSCIKRIIRPEYDDKSSNPIPNNPNCNLHLKDLQYSLNEDMIRDKNGNILYEDGLYGALTDSAIKKVCLSTRTMGKYQSVTAWVQCRVGAVVDGMYGNGTTSKVKEYQIKKKLTVDGIAGYNTIKAILNDCGVIF